VWFDWLCALQVEHFFAFLKRFRILNSVYRGHLDNPRTAQSLADTCKILINISALYLRANPLRVHPRMNGVMESDFDSSNDELVVEPLPLGMVEPDDALVDSGCVIDDFDIGFSQSLWFFSLSYARLFALLCFSVCHCLLDTHAPVCRDHVQAWYRGLWMNARVTYVSAARGTLTVRWSHDGTDTSGYKPSKVRHRPE
jgi:hypothetical protein